MALTNNNTLDIAYKKLVGKTHTSSGFLSSQEENGTFAQLDVSKVFGQVIPSLASQAVSEGIAEEVTLYLKGDSRSQYDESGEGLGTHAFNLYTDQALTIPFQGNIIPDSFGASYAPDLKTDADEKVDKSSNHNWTFDASSAVVWFQNTSVAPVPSDGWKITVYKYIGKSLSETIDESGGSTGGGVTTIDSSPTAGFPPQHTNITLASYELFLLDASTQSIRIELPSVVGNENRKVTFKRKDNNSDNIIFVMGKITEILANGQPSGLSSVEYIDDVGSSSILSTQIGVTTTPSDNLARYLHVQNETLSLYCDGTKWHII